MTSSRLCHIPSLDLRSLIVIIEMVIWVILFAVSSVCTDPISYEGYSVMKSLPKTVQGQDFLDNEIKSHGEECNVWKAPQK